MATLKEKTQVKRLSKTTHHLKNEIRKGSLTKKPENTCVNAAPHTLRSSTELRRASAGARQHR